ncbi:MAG: hypothetical protein BMS9Abin21_026 [Thermodesulfovibrionia bacterium]|nr:MAG: hypothetical protein BMS9Abin21_026 [Thermodesulfovibrionia bacterium]
MKKILVGFISVMFFTVFFSASTANADSAEYLGAKKCIMCHIKQYKSWQKTKMATSFENLKAGVKAEAKEKAGLAPDKDYTTDANCLKCHTTGYGEAGGFKSVADTPKLINVQCEGCHGPGSEYRKIMMRNPKYITSELRAVGLTDLSEDEKTCLKCHGGDSPFNEKLDPKYKFIFKERLKNTHKNFPKKFEH